MREKIPGGLSSGKDPSDFDIHALAKGVKVELEHTTDKSIATEIAMDHLTEDPHYYNKLRKMEKEARAHTEELFGMKKTAMASLLERARSFIHS